MVREMGQSLIFIVSGALQLNLAQIFFQALIRCTCKIYIRKLCETYVSSVWPVSLRTMQCG